MTKEAIYQYVKEQYGTTPEHLWKRDPKSAVLRHKNGKWYAVFMNVDKNKLGIPEEGSVDIMNVKCNPELNGFIARTYGPWAHDPPFHQIHFTSRLTFWYSENLFAFYEWL